MTIPDSYKGWRLIKSRDNSNNIRYKNKDIMIAVGSKKTAGVYNIFYIDDLTKVNEDASLLKPKTGFRRKEEAFEFLKTYMDRYSKALGGV